MSAGRPLQGWRVLVTRPAEQTSGLSDRLRAEGAEPVEVPATEIVPPRDGGTALDDRLGRLDSFDWVAFSSANAVRAVLARLGGPEQLARLAVAAVGRATAEVLEDSGVAVTLLPERSSGGELAAAFPDPPTGGARVLLLQAARARPELAQGLRRRGYEVETVVAYATVSRAADDSLRPLISACRAGLFASPSAVEGFLSSYGGAALPPLVVTIGPTTSRRARQLGCEVAAEAAEASDDGLVRALVDLALAEEAASESGLL